jgi:hypothetical protein
MMNTALGKVSAISDKEGCPFSDDAGIVMEGQPQLYFTGRAFTFKRKMSVHHHSILYKCPVCLLTDRFLVKFDMIVSVEFIWSTSILFNPFNATVLCVLNFIWATLLE